MDKNRVIMEFLLFNNAKQRYFNSVVIVQKLAAMSTSFTEPDGWKIVFVWLIHDITKLSWLENNIRKCIFHVSIIFKLYSPRYPVNITFQGAAAQLSDIFRALFITF